ncbi:MAG: glycosyltransferase [Gemmataceae bacterium]|nr:glycosyltransferase [Gemmataceae bacterium]
MTEPKPVSHSDDDPENPFISVIVPVRNEAAFIERTLSELLTQDYDAGRYEVIVADGQSDDGTADLVKSFQRRHANLHLVANPRQWSSSGRNRAIEASKGEIVLLIDGHCELGNPNYLRDLADAFRRSNADCIGRPQPLDVTGASPLQRAIARARSSPLGHHHESFIYTGKEQYVRPQSVAVAYRRHVFEHVGLFDEAFDACEDVEFNHRLHEAGFRCFFTPRVLVRYHPRSDLTRLFKQMFRYGRGRMRLLVKHPRTFTVPGFLPGAFLAGMIAGAALSLVSSWLAAIYCGTIFSYLLIVLFTSLILSLREGSLSLMALLPGIFPTIHLGAGAGIIVECVALAVPSSAISGRTGNGKLQSPLSSAMSATKRVRSM